MGFSNEIKDEILVKSARHCCVCHKAKGLNIEVHHINPRKQGGSDTLKNAIALCFDCHADAGHFFANHPKGSKLSPNELLKHKVSDTTVMPSIQLPVTKILLCENEVLASNTKQKGRLLKTTFLSL